MKITFILDVKLKKNNGKYYTTAAVTKEYLEKYQFDSKNTLDVICRANESEDINGLALASGKNIEFYDVSNFFQIIKEAKKFEQIIKESNFCIIKMSTIIGILLFKYIRKYNKKYVIELVGDPFYALWNYNLKGKLLAPIMYVINKIIIKNSNNVLYVTDKYLQRRYKNKKNNIGCSDVNIFDTDKSILEERLTKINTYGTGYVYKFGMIASLDSKYKGHDISIKTLSKLKESIKFELHLLGNGNKDKILKEAKKYGILENVFFDGTLPSGKPVFNWLDGIDIYLMPSKLEGMPRALIEAMSRACICVGSRVGGIPELLKEGLLFNKNSVTQMVKVINILISNNEKMKDAAIYCFNKSMNFKKEVLEKKRKEFYDNIMKEDN